MQINIAKHDCTIIWAGVYYFALSDYPHISPWELKKLLTFVNYEKYHGRQTEIICEDADILNAVNNAIAYPETVENAMLPVKITECTACKQQGCLTKFVCYTAPIESARKIFSSGKLLSAVKAFEKASDELVLDIRNGAGDPPDYFNYLMFAWGNCITGDSLITERNFVKTHGRLPTQAELDEENSRNLITGVRFYFRYDDITRHPEYVFGGFRPTRIKDELVLSDYLYACTVPEQYRKEVAGLIPPKIMNKVYYLPQNGLEIWDWSEKVYNFIENLIETDK